MPIYAPPSRPDSPRYQHVEPRDSTNEESVDVNQMLPRRGRGGYMRYVLVFCVVVVFGATLSSVATRTMSELNAEMGHTEMPHYLHHDQDYGHDLKTHSCDCGTSTHEARAMGCKYDTLAASWLPDACRDDELSRQFDDAALNGTWTYFADQNGTRTLTVKELSELPDGNNCFWVTQRWHMLHCTFYWKKLYRQRLTGVIMEKHYDGLRHINHCEMLMLEPGDLDEVITEAAVGLSGDHLELGRSGGCRPNQKNSEGGEEA